MGIIKSIIMGNKKIKCNTKLAVPEFHIYNKRKIFVQITILLKDGDKQFIENCKKEKRPFPSAIGNGNLVLKGEMKIVSIKYYQDTGGLDYSATLNLMGNME